MNPSLKFILAFIVSLEISLKASLTTNILVIAFALVYLLVTKTKLKELLLLIITGCLCFLVPCLVSSY